MSDQINKMTDQKEDLEGHMSCLRRKLFLALLIPVYGCLIYVAKVKCYFLISWKHSPAALTPNTQHLYNIELRDRGIRELTLHANEID